MSYDEKQAAAVLVCCVRCLDETFYATHPTTPFVCPGCRTTPAVSQRGRG